MSIDPCKSSEICQTLLNACKEEPDSALCKILSGEMPDLDVTSGRSITDSIRNFEKFKQVASSPANHPLFGKKIEVGITRKEYSDANDFRQELKWIRMEMNEGPAKPGKLLKDLATLKKAVIESAGPTEVQTNAIVKEINTLAKEIRARIKK